MFFFLFKNMGQASCKGKRKELLS